MTCTTLETGAIELYFYEELPPADRERIATHIRQCEACAAAVEDLRTIRDVLASRPDVSAPAGGDWAHFMRRLDVAVGAYRTAPKVAGFERRRPDVRSYIGLLATAALLAIVTMSVLFVARQRESRQAEPAGIASIAGPDGGATPVATTGLRAAGERHFERSKLVILGLANRNTADATTADWAYERELAPSLLSDTRLYRMAAEQNGLNTLASVMRDLEIVLLETAMAEASDTGALDQIQRLIQKRGLVQKMDAVATVGM